MTTKLRWHCVHVLVAGVIACTMADAQTVDLRCVADGGVALCTEPTPVADPPGAAVDAHMWNYNVCDMAGTFLSREAAWTKVRDGKPIFDPDIVPVSTAFEQIVHNACQIAVTDTGWGQTIPSNILCWTGAPLVRNGSLIRDFRKLSFTGLTPSSTGCNQAWTEVVYAGKWRKIECPRTYNTRTKSNGDLECWKLPPECPERASVGNPITLLDGCKTQREVDYRSRTPGGLEVERFYNSGGYFRFAVAAETAGDVWRTTWDRRILVPPVAGNVLAYAQRADGSLQAFGPAGRELQNNQGGASALLQRLTDATGAATGWRLTTANTDVETYDAAGRLLSMALRTGQTYTLAYTTSGRLDAVTDVFGGSLTFTYDASGRLSGFVAPGNRAYVYGYDAAGRFSSVTYPDHTVRTYHYENVDLPHALTGITDENGNRFATWGYDGSGRATSSRHAGGAEAVTLYYGSFSDVANEGMTTVVDAFGANRSYHYQVAGGVARIKRVTDARGNAISTFDANGNVATYSDRNLNKTTYAYDLARNLEISRTEAYGTTLARTIKTQWHPTFRLPTKVVAPSGVAGIDETTDFVHDAQGNVLQKTSSAGGRTRQWTMTYNAVGQVLTVDGPRTDVSDVTIHTYYDATDPCLGCRGNVRTTTNAAGHVTVFDAYDVDGQPTRITDPNGVATTLSYDARGRLKTRSVNAGDALAETTAFDYDGAGQLVRVTLPDGGFLRYQYDAAHRLTEIADGLGNVIQYTLDAMGNRIQEDVFDPSDRLARTQRRIYDALNRLYNEIGAAGQVSAYRYDFNGNLKTSIDPLNRNTVFNYDALNRMLDSTDAGGGMTRHGYDAKDRLVSVQDPINLTTTYVYDGLGNLTRLSSPDTGVATYLPDAAGNVVGATDARGLATSYVYDALNRQTLATFAGGSVALEYDSTATGGAFARGRLTRITDPSGSTTYTYDAWGRVLRKTQLTGSDASARSLAVEYRYAAGRLTGLTYPSGRDLGYAFDAQGRVSGVTIGGQAVLSGATYFPFGAVQGWTWASGQAYRRDFDLDGRVASLTLGPDTTAHGNETWSFGYDSLNRLTTAALPQGETIAYAYDGNGNRRQETRAGAVTNYGYTAGSNRLQALAGAATRSFAYDAMGNLASNGSVTFTYDGRGRLTQTSNGYRYAINGLGQRAMKSGPGGVTYFVYDEQGRLIGEYDGAGAVRQELVYLGDTPVASVRAGAGGGTTVYPIYSDHLDTPRVITNQANQTVWEWKTDTFGAGAANENPGGLGVFSFNLRFPGQYYDAETGLHYNYFRDYDPSVGRYVESDPIGLDGGVNTFAYVTNHPLRYYDPLGLEGCGSGFFDPIIPNNPFGFPFKGCCDVHDNCYDDCQNKPTKQQCDSTFCSCLSGKCGKYSAAVKWTCEKSAIQYCDKASDTDTSRKAFGDSRKRCNGPLACRPDNAAG